MRASVDLIPEHVASRIVAINEQLLLSHVMLPCDREKLTVEQSRLWDEHFPGQAFEDIAGLVPAFMIAA